jgi:hypothetical protein
MYRYLVVDTCAATRLIALRDPSGGYHVARCNSSIPDVNAVLEGALQARGVGMLTGEGGQSVRLIFKHLYCGPRQLPKLLNPNGVPAKARGVPAKAQVLPLEALSAGV